jgi:hypothetical protein
MFQLSHLHVSASASLALRVLPPFSLVNRFDGEISDLKARLQFGPCA